jgi:hypothetical protein
MFQFRSGPAGVIAKYAVDSQPPEIFKPPRIIDRPWIKGQSKFATDLQHLRFDNIVARVKAASIARSRTLYGRPPVPFLA